MSMESKISQKEYLKKYLSGEKKKKKKKKKDDVKSVSRIKIVDDDISTQNFKVENDDDLILTGEDAPQIVGIVDDRPAELRTVEDFRCSGKWKSLFPTEENYTYNKKKYMEVTNDLRSRKQDVEGGECSKDISKNEFKKTVSDEDLSPPRRPKRGLHLDAKKRKENECEGYSSDYSPPRKSNRRNGSSSNRRISDAYLITDSKHDRSRSPKSSYGSKLRRNFDDKSSFKKESRNRSPSKSKSTDDDFSPVRRPTTHKSVNVKSTTRSRFSNDGDDSSDPSLKNTRKLTIKKEFKSSKEETQYIRKSEDEICSKIPKKRDKSPEINVRNKQSMILTKAEIELKRAQEENEQKKKETYNRWGVGLKQIDDYKNKIENEMHESNKPFARYSDDADLDKMLKEQEREGDPMLAYIRERDKEKNKESKRVIIPKYNGPFPENRFNIRPGYRWDGVDRSNGYENKWFDTQNQKRALQEEAYRYSTEDM